MLLISQLELLILQLVFPVFMFSTCGIKLVTRGFELVNRGFELVNRDFEVAICGFELVTCDFELVTCISELVTRVLLLHCKSIYFIGNFIWTERKRKFISY